MISLLPALMFYIGQITSGVHDPITIKDYIVTEALIMGVNPQIALGVVERESNFDCERIGDQGTSYGCWQIHLPAHADITPEQAKDPIFATEWSLREIKKNGCKIWSTCADTMKSLSRSN